LRGGYPGLPAWAYVWSRAYSAPERPERGVRSGPTAYAMRFLQWRACGAPKEWSQRVERIPCIAGADLGEACLLRSRALHLRSGGGSHVARWHWG
jgi:hypothetical protein